MNARKHPRTLQEAFGPYTSNDIEEMPPVSDFLKRLRGAWLAGLKQYRTMKTKQRNARRLRAMDPQDPQSPLFSDTPTRPENLLP